MALKDLEDYVARTLGRPMIGEEAEKTASKMSDRMADYLRRNGVDPSAPPAPAPEDNGLWDRSIEQAKQFGSALWEGTKSTARAAAATVDTYAGNDEDVVELSKSQQADAGQSRALEMEKFNAELARRKRANAPDEDPGFAANFVQGSKDLGGAMRDQPTGFLQASVNQVPNMAATVAGGYIGATIGSAIPVVGTFVGGVVGMTIGYLAGNTITETGFKALEKAQDGVFSDQDRSDTIKEGAIKGAGVTVGDMLSFGASKFVLGTTRRAAEQAALQSLARSGVDVSDRAAVKAAFLEQKLGVDATNAALKAAAAAAEKSSTLVRRTGRGAAVAGSEATGEFSGEYFGELAATGKADMHEALLEGVMGLHQSVGEHSIHFAWEKGKDVVQTAKESLAGRTQDPQQPSAVQRLIRDAFADVGGAGVTVEAQQQDRARFAAILDNYKQAGSPEEYVKALDHMAGGDRELRAKLEAAASDPQLVDLGNHDFGADPALAIHIGNLSHAIRQGAGLIEDGGNPEEQGIHPPTAQTVTQNVMQGTDQAPVNSGGWVPESLQQEQAQVDAVRAGRIRAATVGLESLPHLNVNGVLPPFIATGRDGRRSAVITNDAQLGQRAVTRAFEVGLDQAMGEVKGYANPTLTAAPNNGAAVVQQRDPETGALLDDQLVRPEDIGRLQRVPGTTVEIKPFWKAAEERLAGLQPNDPRFARKAAEPGAPKPQKLDGAKTTKNSNRLADYFGGDRTSVGEVAHTSSPVYTKLAQAIKQAWGVDLVVVKFRDGNGVTRADGTPTTAFHGMALDGKFYLSEKAAGDLKNSALGTMGHELAHILKTQFPEIYRKLAYTVVLRIRRERLAQYAVKLADHREKEGKALNDPNDPFEAELLDEMVAESIGEMTQDIAFWENLFGRIGDEQQAKTLYDTVLQLLQNWAKAFTRVGWITGVRDMQTVRRAITHSYLDWSRAYAAQNASTAPTTDVQAAPTVEAQAAPAPAPAPAPAVAEAAPTPPAPPAPVADLPPMTPELLDRLLPRSEEEKPPAPAPAAPAAPDEGKPVENLRKQLENHEALLATLLTPGGKIPNKGSSRRNTYDRINGLVEQYKQQLADLEGKQEEQPAEQPAETTDEKPGAEYWHKQIRTHRKMAQTLREKHAKTGEARWLKQAETNERNAAALANKYGDPDAAGRLQRKVDDSEIPKGLPKRLTATTAIDIRSKPYKGDKLNINQVAAYFDAITGRRDFNDPAEQKRAVKQLVRELSYQLEQEQNGLDWYEEDIQRSFEITERYIPSLKNPSKRELFSVFAALLSPNTKAHMNWSVAAQAFKHYEETGIVPGRNPETGGLWVGGTTSANKEKALNFLNNMIQDIKEEAAIAWILGEHTVKELNDARAKWGNMGPGVAGKMTDRLMGAFAFGPKVGPFMMNINGLHELTVDMWATRTFNRMFGTMVGPDGLIVDAPTEPQRRVAKEIFNEAARQVGIADYQAQSVEWFFEQQLFNHLGTGTESHSFSEGAALFAEREDGLRNTGAAGSQSPAVGGAAKKGGNKASPEGEVGRQQRKEEVDANPGVNMRRLAKLLGPKLYGDTSEMGAVAVKEMFQNEFDAIKQELQKGSLTEGQIFLGVNKAKRQITMAGNGSGMTTSILGNQFLQIAGTHKETDRSSGGLGIAKMQFLFGSKDLEVFTLRDGVLSILRATGPQLMEAMEDPAQKPKIEVMRGAEALAEFRTHYIDAMKLAGTRSSEIGVEPDALPSHGTIATVTVPDSYEDPSTGDKHNIEMPYLYGLDVLEHSPLFENIKVRAGTDGSGYNRDIGANFPYDAYTHLFDAKFQWGTASIYVTKDASREWNQNMHFLSNGLWQFSGKLAQDPTNTYSDPIQRRLYVNITPTVKPEDAGYPFDLNRQQFAKTAKDDFSKIQSYLNMLYARDVMTNEAKEMANVNYISEDGRMEAVQGLTAPKGTAGLTNTIDAKDKVEVRDGKLIVNGRVVPVMSREDMAAEKLGYDEYMVPKGTVDVNRPLLHDNLEVPHNLAEVWLTDMPDATAAVELMDKVKALRDKLTAEQFPTIDASTPRLPFTEVMRGLFGKRFDKMNAEFAYAFRKLADAAIDYYHKDIGHRDWVSVLMDTSVGVAYDINYRGVNSPKPFKAMFINPAATERTDPRRGPVNMLNTMIHEITHEKVHGHGVPFEQHMAELQGDLYGDSPAAKQALDDIRSTFAQHQDIIQVAHGAFFYALRNKHARALGRNLQANSDLQHGIRSDGSGRPAGVGDQLESQRAGGAAAVAEGAAGSPGSDGRQQDGQGLPGEGGPQGLGRLQRKDDEGLGDFAKRLRNEIKAHVEANAALVRQHDWKYKVGDVFLSTKTGKTYTITGRNFQKRILRDAGFKKTGERLEAVYYYESGNPPPTGLTQAQQDAWPHEWERGSMFESKLATSTTMKPLTAPRLQRNATHLDGLQELDHFLTTGEFPNKRLDDAIERGQIGEALQRAKNPAERKAALRGWGDSLIETFADGLIQVQRWAENLPVSNNIKQRLVGSMQRAASLRANLEAEVTDKFAKPMFKAINKASKASKRDTDSVKKLAGSWMSARHIPFANANLMAKDRAALADAQAAVAREQQLIANLRTRTGPTVAMQLANAQDRLLQAQSAVAVAQQNLQDRMDDVNGPAIPLNAAPATFKRGVAGGMSNATAALRLSTIESMIDPTLLAAIARPVYEMMRWKTDLDLNSGKVTQTIVNSWPASPTYVPLTGDPRYNAEYDDVLDGGNALNQSADEAMNGRKTSIPEDGIDAAFKAVVRSTNFSAQQDFKNELNSAYTEATRLGIDIGLKRSPVTPFTTNGGNAVIHRWKQTNALGHEFITAHAFTFDNPAIIEALKHDNVNRADMWAKKIGTPTRWMARGVTQWSLVWPAVNAVVDLWERSELVRTRKLYDTNGNEVNVKTVARQAIADALNPEVWLAAAVHAVQAGYMTSVRGDLEELIRLGGLSTWGGHVARKASDLEREIRKSNTGALGWRNIPRGLTHLVETWNRLFEVIPTLVSYRALKSQGMDPVDAAGAVLDLMNFHKHGAHMANVSSLFVFAQPAATSGYNLMRYLSTRTGQVRMAGQLVVFSAIAALLGAAWGGDDDDDEDSIGNKFDNLSNFTVERKIPIPVGDMMVKVPVGFGPPQLAWITAVTLRRWAVGRYDAVDAVTEIAKSWIKSMAPVSPSDMELIERPVTWLFQTLTPSVAKPVLSIATEETQMGGQLTPQFKNPNQLKSEQAQRSTPQFYLDVAKALHDSTGIDMYPDHIKAIISGYAIGLLREILTYAVDNPGKVVRGEKERIMFLSSLVDNVNDRAILNSVYYRVRKDLEAVHREYKSREEKDTLDGWLTDARQAQVDAFETFAAAEKALQKRRSEAYKTRGEDASEAVREIEQESDEAHKEVLKEYFKAAKRR